MDRRTFLSGFGITVVSGALSSVGCKSTQHAKVMTEKDKRVVASHKAGAETWEPLIDESVSRLLGQQASVMQASATAGLELGRQRICFCGVENRSSEELGDFKEQIYQKINSCISQSGSFDVVNKRFVEKGLYECGLRSEDLFIPDKRRQFLQVMEQNDQPINSLLFAVVTSGTSSSNDTKMERDYTLTLELIDVQTGRSIQDSADLRKLYKKSRLGGL